MPVISGKLRGILNKFTDSKASLTVEFSFISLVFVFMVFFIFELCRYLFVSAAIDSTLSTAARNASTQVNVTTDYNVLFRNAVRNESALWGSVIDHSLLYSSVKYCTSIDRAIAGPCSSTAAAGKMLAYYQIGYRYRPFLFSGGLPGMSKLINTLQSSLTRQLIYVQEYERDEIFKSD